VTLKVWDMAMHSLGQALVHSSQPLQRFSSTLISGMVKPPDIMKICDWFLSYFSGNPKKHSNRIDFNLQGQNGLYFCFLPGF
jgi:hypothetical protein